MAIIPNSTVDHSTNREGAALVYDTSRTELVYFGGKAVSSIFADTWTQVDAGSWTQQLATVVSGSVSSPGLRFNHTMAYQPTVAQTVLFGGINNYQMMNDTWVWTTAWTQVTYSTPYLSVNAPTPRYGHEMIGDGYSGGNVILFGGIGQSPMGTGKSDNFQFLQDTWVFSSSNVWTQTTSAITPPVRAFHAMAYNTSNVIMWGGQNSDGAFLNDMWSYTDTTTQWAAVSQGSTIPSARMGHAMTYDGYNSRLFLFGGLTQSYGTLGLSCQTWVFSGGAWTLLSTPTHPTARWNAQMQYDSGTKKITLIGGRGNGVGSYSDVLGDVWTFDCVAGTWSGAGDFSAAQSTAPVY